MNNPEAVAYLEQDYDQLDFTSERFPRHAREDGLVFLRASGWRAGANVVRPMFEVIDDVAAYRHLDGE